MVDSSLKEVLESIAANVRKTRVKRGMTQEVLSEAADVDLRTLQRIERGTMNTRLGIVVKIANALDVQSGRLFRKAKLLPAVRGRPPSKSAKKRKPE